MLYTAFLFGIISSFHCIGMCGPIALMLPVDRSNSAKKTIQILIYNLGRLTAYASIGLVFGLLGKGFFMAGFQQNLSLFIGLSMIALVLIPEKLLSKYNFSKQVFRIISKIKTALGSQFKNKSYRSFFTIGLLNGFLPCGMVYVALFGAIAMQSASLGVLYMLLFGLGTIPLMSCVLYVNVFLTTAIRNRIQKAVPDVVVAIACLFVLRGLGLGIPYLSPATTSLFIQASPNCH